MSRRVGVIPLDNKQSISIELWPVGPFKLFFLSKMVILYHLGDKKDNPPNAFLK